MDKTTYYYNIFLQKGLTLNSVYKENEILDTLDSLVLIFFLKTLIIKFSVKATTTYNREIAAQIFERIGSNITIPKFVVTLIEAETIINEKLSRTTGSIEQYSVQKQNFLNILANTKEEENCNPLGINVDNNLVVDIKNLSGLFSKTNELYYIKIKYGYKEILTQKKKISVGNEFNQILNM